MSANSYYANAYSNTSELMHKLGFPDQPSHDRKQEIKENMFQLQQWLDDNDDYEPIPVRPSSPLMDTIAGLAPCTASFMGRPAVLIASTGSIRRKKRNLDANAKQSKVSFSNNSTHSGTTKRSSSSVTTNVDTLESFPMFTTYPPTTMEAQDDGQDEKMESEEGTEVSMQPGLRGGLSRLWRMFRCS
ncbi:hypothetical protein IQ06DRAFT_349733 [Phaeosphaeriaceae sp. SRC1lsM3a]|nr:hypothetical protein IQ06DRAFT_349733 [Stagonospora sp. SRC1lsM3a]